MSSWKFQSWRKRTDASWRIFRWISTGLVEDVGAFYRPEAESKGLSFSTRISAHVPRFVCGDAGALRQVLQNIVANAVKFTARGSVAASVQAAESNGHPALVHFSVTDTGIGVPA